MKYLESLQLAFEGGGVGAEAVAGLVHLIKILIINLSYLFLLREGRMEWGAGKWASGFGFFVGNV